MDKRGLQTYAVWAKTNLESQIEVSLKTLGINSENNIKEARQVGEYTIIDGDSNSYPKDLKTKRDQIVRLVKTDGYKQVIEEFAYTWFNRIIALRFMEVHDFLPHGFRVLSSRDGGIEPEIMKNLNFVKDELKLDLNLVSSLRAQGKIEEAYRYVLFRQCNALSGILPMLFASDQDYLELLAPKSLIKGETIISKLLEIGEDSFLDDVEVIGWLYQFYVADDRQAFRDAKIVTKDLIPTLTQVFTPDWIVRYMAENSVGRIWLESYPNSPLKSEMKYYVDDAKQEEDVQQKIDAIKYKNVNPEDIRIVEPCCGSGHILVYVFDLLYKMYEEKGYQAREIPSLILKKNLVGLEIDKRAAQLASFSLVMKARALNSRFFNDNYYVTPEVYEIWDARTMLSLDYETQIKELHLLSNDELKNIKWLVETFRYAKTIGSLLKVEKKDFKSIKQSIDKLKNEAVLTIFNGPLLNEGTDCLYHLLAQAILMSEKYDVIITNPPYLGITKMEKQPKDYLSTYYPNSKSDMFGMFMEVPYIKRNGFRAMVNPDSWMFLVSFEALRKSIIQDENIVNMIHLGMGTFDAVVQTTSFVIRNSKISTNGTYFRLVDSKNKEEDFLKNIGGYIVNTHNFIKIPGSVIGYWMSENMLKVFDKSICLSEYADAKNGFTTGNNDLFLRFWYEVSLKKIGFGATDVINALYMGTKWFPYNKGGAYRKWYGNQEYVVNWDKDGKDIKKYGHLVPRSMNYMFFESISWSKISSGDISFRYMPKGFMFDVAGLSMFCNENYEMKKTLAFINTNITKNILKILSPTLNYEVGQIASLPIIKTDNDSIDKITDSCIEITKEEWDSFETSWNYKKHPLI